MLSLLAGLGSCFDTASVAEIEMVLAAGATADRISFGNTIKKERDIARAYALTDIEPDLARCREQAGPLFEDLAGHVARDWIAL